MKEYAFAANPFKLQRAIATVGREEAAVKAEYIRLGGLLVEGHEPEIVEEPVVIEEVAETFAENIEAPVEPSPKPKKAAKKK